MPEHPEQETQEPKLFCECGAAAQGLTRKEPLAAVVQESAPFLTAELSDHELCVSQLQGLRRRPRLFACESQSGLVCLKGEELVTPIQTAPRVLKDVIR